VRTAIFHKIALLAGDFGGHTSQVLQFIALKVALCGVSEQTYTGVAKPDDWPDWMRKFKDF